jgi:ribonuclease HI
MITLRFDGLYRTISPNNDPREVTGLMCYGWVIFRDGRLVAHGHGAFARPESASSNSAEYLAMIEGLQALRDMGVQREAVEVIGDARSVIEQMLGLAGVSSPQARPLYQRAMRLARHFRDLRWMWQPRRDNAFADQLTRRALKMVKCNRESTRQALQEAARRRAGLMTLLDLSVFNGA